MGGSSWSIATRAGIAVAEELKAGKLAVEERKRYPWQRPPTATWFNDRGQAVPWQTWLLIGGRGTGKTEGGARWVIEQLRKGPDAKGQMPRIGIGAPTRGDARQYCAEGETGLITLYRREFVRWNRTDLEATHRLGGFVKFQGSEDSSRWNGPQWTHLWMDELGLWKMNPRIDDDSFEQSQLGLRLGKHPQMLITTTLKRHKRRNIKVLKALMAEAGRERGVVMTHGTTPDAYGLSQSVRDRLMRRYGGTELGKQELLGMLIEAAEGALWRSEWIDENRVEVAPDLHTVVVAVDPSGGSTSEHDEIGIVCAGLGWCNCNGDREEHAFVLDDVSGHLTPNAWARRSVAVYKRRQADRIIGEANYGGDMVENTITNVDKRVNYLAVTASRGKAVRAAPVAALYEPRARKVHHVGTFEELEEQLCSWTPEEKGSPDRLDALVWAITDLLVSGPTHLTGW